MHAQTSFAPARKIAGYLGLLIIALIIAGLFTVSFASGMAVLAGILVYFLFAWAFHIARAKVLWLLIPVFVIGLIILLSLVTKPPVAPHICAVASYRVVFIPQTPQVKSIKIQEFVTLNASVSFTPPADWTAAEVANQPGFSLPEVYATIKNRGFLLNEASFQSSVPCSNKTEVELDDFPLNSFYAAHNAQSL